MWCGTKIFPILFDMVLWRQEKEGRCLLLEIGSRYLQHEKNCFMLARIIITVDIWLLNIRCMRRMLGRGAVASSVVSRQERQSEERSLVPVETSRDQAATPPVTIFGTFGSQQRAERTWELRWTAICKMIIFYHFPHLLTDRIRDEPNIRNQNFPLKFWIFGRYPIWTHSYFKK